MNLDDKTKLALQELNDAIQLSFEESDIVRDAIDRVRKLGFEPLFTVNVQITLEETHAEPEIAEVAELEITDEDIKTLQRMKILL